MVSLYVNIPINEFVEVINHIIDPNTTKLVEIFLTSTFLSFVGEFYENTYNISMGSLLSPVITNYSWRILNQRP